MIYVYDGTNGSAIDILWNIGIWRVRSFYKSESESLAIIYEVNRNKTASIALDPGDSITVYSDGSVNTTKNYISEDDPIYTDKGGKNNNELKVSDIFNIFKNTFPSAEISDWRPICHELFSNGRQGVTIFLSNGDVIEYYPSDDTLEGGIEDEK